MKITGGRNYVVFDLENGYVMKASGEIAGPRDFVVFKDSMNQWEPPHEYELVMDFDRERIIQEVERMTTPKTAQLKFV